MPAAAARPFSVSRTASVTWAPAPDRARAAARPIPLLAPVMITVRPVMSGRSWAEAKVVISNNVVDDNNAVNAHISSLVCAPMAARPYHHGNLRVELLTQAERTVRERGV